MHYMEDFPAADFPPHEDQVPVLARGWWHELNTPDVMEAVRFYSKTLGWRFDEIALADGSFYRVARQNGRPVCGLFQIVREHHGDVPAHWMSYMKVDELNAALRAACFAGGEVMRAPVAVPGLGRLALLADSTGAMIGLMEAYPAALVTGRRERAALKPLNPG